MRIAAPLRIVALLLIAFALLAPAGCSASTNSGSSSAHVAAPVPKPVTGTLQGFQVTAASKLQPEDKQKIAEWVANDAPADSAPTLAAGTFAPIVDGHVQLASVEATSDNGIMTQVATVQLDPAGSKALADYTTAHPSETVVVVLGDKVVMAGTLGQPIVDGLITLPGQESTIQLLRSSIQPALP